MRITIDMIPYGFDNRITKQTLMDVTGLCERNVREQIAILATKYPICTCSKWSGIFKPLPGERRYVEMCRKETYSRGLEVFNRLGMLDEFLKVDLQPSLVEKE